MSHAIATAAASVVWLLLISVPVIFSTNLRTSCLSALPVPVAADFTRCGVSCRIPMIPACSAESKQSVITDCVDKADVTFLP